MPPLALGMVLVAAVLHAGWNLFVKRAREKQVFTLWGLMVGSVCFAPILLFSQPFPFMIWPYVICSAVVEGIYYIVLTRAYESGDFSLVYPMARGAAPAFLVLWAILFLGERPRPLGLIGVALLICGLVLVGGNTWWSMRKTTSMASLRSSGLGLALGVAFCISIYSVIDGAAVHLVAPAPYTVVVISLSTIFIFPFIFLRYGRKAVVVEWHTNWWRIIVVGILMLASYMLVLQSYAIAHVSYAGAIREISVVFAAFMGWRWLGEKLGLLRMVGAAILFIGILVIALGG